MVAGDVVNTAARLQTAAPVNGVLVDETDIPGHAQVIEYREARAGGGEGQGRAGAGLGGARGRRPARRRHRLQAGAPLVGRDRELHFLPTRSARVRARAGAAARHADRRARDRQEPAASTSCRQAVDAEPELIGWRQGRSLPYGDGISYWALGEMAKAQAGILEIGPAEAARSGSSPRRRGRPRRTGSGSGPGEPAAAGRARRPDRALAATGEARPFAAWRQLLRGARRAAPDGAGVRGPALGRRRRCSTSSTTSWTGPTGVPLLVVCTARPELLERRPGWGGGKRNARPCRSRRCPTTTPRGCSRPARAAVLPAETQTALLARAGGNPLYAEEFAPAATPRAAAGRRRRARERAGHHRGPARRAAGRREGAAAGRRGARQGVLARRGRGDRRPAPGRDRAAAARAASARSSSAAQRRSSVGGEDEFAFRHVLVRDVAYGQIPRPPRAEQAPAGGRAGSSRSGGRRRTPRCWRTTTWRRSGWSARPGWRSAGCRTRPG